MVSCNILFSNESVEEIDRYLNSKQSIVGPTGKFSNSADTAIPKRAFLAFTKGEPTVFI